MVHRETVHVLGATPKDTEIGQAICRKKGLISKAMHVSSNPEKQAVLHTYDIPELEDKVVDLILQNHARDLIVFCNSLSFSLDWNSVKKKTECRIFDIRAAYRQVIGHKNAVAILAADCITLERISKYIKKHYPKAIVKGYALFPLVEYAEKHDDMAQTIIGDLVELTKRIGIDTFIVGCTHFEKYSLNNSKGSEIVYPGTMIIEEYLKTAA